MSDAVREAIEERAAIMEHDGGLNREDAERSAAEIDELRRILALMDVGRDAADRAMLDAQAKAGDDLAAIRGQWEELLRSRPTASGAR